MGTRLIVNLVQVYTPLYILDSLNMYKVFTVNDMYHREPADLLQVAIAVAPLVIYISGLLSTFSINYINKWAGQYVSCEHDYSYL